MFPFKGAGSVTVAVLLAVTVLQLGCHAATAITLFHYLRSAPVGPTAALFDSFVFGTASLVLSLGLSAFAVLIGLMYLIRNERQREH